MKDHDRDTREIFRDKVHCLSNLTALQFFEMYVQPYIHMMHVKWYPLLGLVMSKPLEAETER